VGPSVRSLMPMIADQWAPPAFSAAFNAAMLARQFPASRIGGAAATDGAGGVIRIIPPSDCQNRRRHQGPNPDYKFAVPLVPCPDVHSIRRATSGAASSDLNDAKSWQKLPIAQEALGVRKHCATDF